MVRTISTPARMRGGQSAGDISAKLEQEVLRLQTKLDQLKAEVRQAQTLASMGTALMMIAHEFKNWVTPLKGRAQRALATSDPVDTKKALETAVNNVDVIAHFCNRLLELSAADLAAPTIVGVRRTVELAFEAMCGGFEKNKIRFKNDVDESITCLADPLHLQQVLFNLFINAHEILPKIHGRISVTAQRTGERVQVIVSDNGPGIPPELLPHIFEAFETSKRGRNSEGQKRCGGLGLAICRDLVTSNGGTITAASKPGAGTTFTIDLPNP